MLSHSRPPASSRSSPQTPAIMCLFAASTACKLAPALSFPSPTSTKPKTIDEASSSDTSKFKLTCKDLVKFSLPVLYLVLTFLLVPQACASPYLSSCPLDPSSNPYSMEVLFREHCYFQCIESSCYIMLTPCIVFGLVIVLHSYLYVRRSKAAIKQMYARIVEREEMVEKYSRLVIQMTTILDMQENTEIMA